MRTPRLLWALQFQECCLMFCSMHDSIQYFYFQNICTGMIRNITILDSQSCSWLDSTRCASAAAVVKYAMDLSRGTHLAGSSWCYKGKSLVKQVWAYYTCASTSASAPYRFLEPISNAAFNFYMPNGVRQGYLKDCFLPHETAQAFRSSGCGFMFPGSMKNKRWLHGRWSSLFKAPKLWNFPPPPWGYPACPFSSYYLFLTQINLLHLNLLILLKNVFCLLFLLQNVFWWYVFYYFAI